MLKNPFLPTFDLVFDLLSGSPENLLLTNFSTCFDFFEVWGLLGSSPLHKFWFDCVRI